MDKAMDDVPYIWPVVPTLMDIQFDTMLQKLESRIEFVLTQDRLIQTAEDWQRANYDEHIVVGTTRIFYES
jgi:hypothetical protein